ncbi:copper chaperone CopZ [Kineococcus xinjiangensis]|uniref:Copper chaperone CopZ n=1 Tax=Kineococcus xinjiangensis TaxID=512762 RepID=A0A2S6IM76_9ACTN|nr:heavy-metal-associated domain-containing protein [Kineococcus xinjiangensis]PPK95344.1 copper chaperone CopZ [Kineococcus xinjiangensis]
MTEQTSTSRYGVTGMTCGHCVSAVREEVSALDGVRAVDVELVTGGTSTVTVTSDAPLPEESVRAAVDEAGYELTGPLA